jgi:hypothetical protein
VLFGVEIGWRGRGILATMAEPGSGAACTLGDRRTLGGEAG